MEGEREQDLDQGEESFKWNWKHMKSVFFWYPNAHLLATSYNGPSEWDRASVRGRETAKPHERRLRLHLSFWHSNSQSSKLSSLESSICFFGLLSVIICSILFRQREKGIILNAILQKQLSISYSVTQFNIFFSEIGWKAAFSLLTHVDAWVQKSRYCCKCTVCSYHGNSVQNEAKLCKATLRYITFKQWTAEARQRSKSHIQSYNMFTVLKYAMKYSV